MKISDFSIKRNITIFMLVIAVLIFGYISFTRLNIALFPDIDFPAAAVITTYSGTASEEIESMITDPIEEQLTTVEDVDTINSTSSMGRSTVVVEFNWGRDLDFAALDMREQIDTIKGTLPEGADEPMVVKFDPDSMPIIRFAVSGDYSREKLKDIAEDSIMPRLERIAGVASADLSGGRDREILVELDQNKLENYNLDASSVIQAISAENVNISGGTFTRGNKKLLLRTMGKFDSVETIRQLSISVADNQGFVKLHRVATVSDTFAEIEEMTRLNGENSLGISITKQSNTNTVNVANLAKEEMQEISQDLQIESEIVRDNSEFIEHSIDNVVNSGLIGAVLAIIILFIFLRNISSTIVIGLSIPISIVATFVLVYFGGLTLNLISLGGLTLGIGMVVDNSVVVLENIYRMRTNGKGRIQAASEGSSEVGSAIIASTMTTLSIFVPIMFMEGIASEMFTELGLTISFALAASLLVALTVVPMLSSLILHVKDKDRERHGQDGFITRSYRATLGWSLRHRWVVILILVLALAGSFGLARQVGFEFFPSFDEGELTIEVELPNGTVLEETDQVIKQIEERVKNMPEVETYFSSAGSGGGGGMMGGGTNSETGYVDLRLVDQDRRDKSTMEVAEELRKDLSFPDVDISISATSMGPSQSEHPISIKVFGDNLEQLESLSSTIVDQVDQVEGVREVESSFTQGDPELHIGIDRQLASRFNLRINQIGYTISTAIDGNVASKFEDEGEEHDIRVKFAGEEEMGLQEIRKLIIPTATGARVPLDRVANFRVTTGPQEILREDQTRYSEITADLYGVPLGTAMTEIRQRLDDNLDLPEGYNLAYGGESEDMRESFEQVGFALLLGVILLYMVMASQFQSLLHPFVIMFTVPMAIIGVILGLYITGHRFSLPAGIGLLTLVGIVVNNAIVLVDYINLLRDRGHGIREAILEAGPIRLRPVTMTALTTVLALVPMAMGLGEGTEIQQPMSIVIASGLAFSTLLTLYVIPVLYSFIAPFGIWLRRKLGLIEE